MKATFLEIFIVIIGSNALFSFVTYLIDRHDKRKETPERMMLAALGADRLGILLRRWLHNDVRTAADWEIIERLYSGYSALGCNGEIKKLYEEAKTIPTTE